MTRPKRALWLLNHTTLRNFEVPLLSSLGYEVFTPKRFPYSEENVSASVTYEFDPGLTIPPADLASLNAHDFYGELTPEITELINAHFDIAIFGFFFTQLSNLVREFKGILVLRTFGSSGLTYTEMTSNALGRFFARKIEGVERRFWFGQAYENLAEIETGVYRRKAVNLPLGLPKTPSRLVWTGEDAKILFVCPRIETSPYYRNVYDEFKKHFGDLPHVIGGAQPVPVKDPKVIGFVSRSAYDDIMRRARVMFYHSQEKRHLHYHPLEAVRLGMPLLFMGGGMLDHLGGKGLPGRCQTLAEARSKVERVLKNDQAFIQGILESQPGLLASMDADKCAALWRTNMQSIESAPLDCVTSSPKRKTRIAVIVPMRYRGGTLRGAKLLAESIERGSRKAGAAVEVVFGHLTDPNHEDAEFDDLPDTIERRVFKWREMSRAEALRATKYAGYEQALAEPTYIFPDDGVQQFTDCDLFVFVSDRLKHPLLPIRPYVLMIYDYLQRYESFLSDAENSSYIQRAREAEAVMVTTDFTMRDAIQFAGVPTSKLTKVPMLVPDFSQKRELYARSTKRPGYFIWTTNNALHKNHENAFKALRTYYEDFDGQLECRVTGAGVEGLLTSRLPHLKPLRAIHSSSAALKRNLRTLGELRDARYRSELADAAWLWHAGRVDNGTFAVIEAAHYGVPSLSSDYPAMREIDETFGLHLAWMDARNPKDMAQQLKQMESSFEQRRGALPSADQLTRYSADRLATEYWDVIRGYL